MSDVGKAPMIPKYNTLIWLSNGTPEATAAISARFSDKLRLHVNAGEVGGVMRYMSGVVLVADGALQAAGFYATDPDYAKQLAYQLAIVIAPDFI